jgi:hypothetical protein
MQGSSLGFRLGALAFITLVLTALFTAADMVTQWKTRDLRARIVATGLLATLFLGALVSGAGTYYAAQDNARLHEQVNEQGTAVNSAISAVDTARARLAELQTKTAALSTQSQRALAAAKRASFQTGNMVVRVQQLNSNTNRQLAQIQQLDTDALAKAGQAQQLSQNALSTVTKAETIANRAAAKAGVYKFPTGIASQIETALAKSSPGRASMACAPGLESACNDLGRIFAKAGWQARTTLGASFWTYAGFDPATPDPGGQTGIYVWCRPGRGQLGRELQGALEQTGVAVGLRALSGSPPDDIEISLIFVTR